jgi:hypothetical protein
VTDRDASLVEERVTRVKKLLEGFDLRIAILSKYFSETAAACEAENSVAGAVAPATAQPPPTLQPPEAAIAAQPPPVMPPTTASVAAQPPSNQPPPEAVLVAVAAQPPLSDQVAAQLREGLSPAAIAARLGVSVGEIELAMLLPRR